MPDTVKQAWWSTLDLNKVLTVALILLGGGFGTDQILDHRSHQAHVEEDNTRIYEMEHRLLLELYEVKEQLESCLADSTRGGP